MALPFASSGSNKRKHPGDADSAAFVDLRDLTEHEARKPKLESDDEISEEDADMADDEPYDEAQEAYPQRPAFDKSLHALDEKTAALTKRLQSLLEQHISASSHLQNMKSKAEEAMLPPTPKRLMVAMVGATGAGKTFDSLATEAKLTIIVQARVRYSTRSPTRHTWRKRYAS
jgi:flagellar biosynthesis GTPase FlhF